MNNPALQLDQDRAKCLVIVLWLQNSSKVQFKVNLCSYIMLEHLIKVFKIKLLLIYIFKGMK